MKRRSKAMGSSRSLKMGFLIRFLFVTFIGRAIALASSDKSPENSTERANEIQSPNKTNSSGENNRSFPTESNDLLNRKSRAISFSESSESTQTPEEKLIESQSNNLDSKNFMASILDVVDKRAIPMMRFGRSEMSMIPSLQFGRSSTSMIPTIRFGRSDASMIPTIRFGRSKESMIPSIRFGRSNGAMIPTIRFGRSGSSMIPAMRFGRSDDSIIPMLRFGRSFENLGDEYESPEGHEDQTSIVEQHIGKSDSIIPYSNLGRSAGTGSEGTSNRLEFLNRVLKRQANDSLIPQIRYGRSSLKAKKTNEIKPPFFILPNIRPGRSANEDLDTSEETGEPYFSDVQGFLGLFGAFRRSDDDIKDDSKNLQEMESGKKVGDVLFDGNAGNTYTQLENEMYKTNKDPLYVIPYPRPGKRQLGKYPSVQTNVEKSNTMSSPHLFKINKISDYVLPYPRPGKKSQGTENVRLRAKRSTSILPYPRPGTSVMLPYPRPGRSMIMLPYPRPGRSHAEGNYMLPYPRPGKSKQSSFSGYDKNILEYENESKRTKRSTQNYELAYMLTPDTKKIAGNVISDLENFENIDVSDENESILLDYLKKFKGHEVNSNAIYMLPYPRPGRNV